VLFLIGVETPALRLFEADFALRDGKTAFSKSGYCELLCGSHPSAMRKQCSSPGQTVALLANKGLVERITVLLKLANQFFELFSALASLYGSSANLGRSPIALDCCNSLTNRLQIELESRFWFLLCG
jgi:hypothetical protein